MFAGGGAEAPPEILVVRRNDGQAFHRMCPILINSELVQLIGAFKSCRRSKDGLIINTTGPEQAVKALQITSLSNCPVTVAAHPANYSRGVIRHPDLRHCDDQRVLEELQKQGVREFRRMYRKDSEGELIPTATGVITFPTPHLPSHVKVGFLRMSVSPYYYSPRRCLNCQQFGHIRNNCKNSPICPCGLPETHDTCSTNPECPNCKGNHRADSKHCPSYLAETNIEKIRAEKGISYYEAKKLVARPATKSYSSVTGTTNLTPTLHELITQLRPLLTEIVKQVIHELRLVPTCAVTPTTVAASQQPNEDQLTPDNVIDASQPLTPTEYNMQQDTYQDTVTPATTNRQSTTAPNISNRKNQPSKRPIISPPETPTTRSKKKHK